MNSIEAAIAAAEARMRADYTPEQRAAAEAADEAWEYRHLLETAALALRQAIQVQSAMQRCANRLSPADWAVYYHTLLEMEQLVRRLVVAMQEAGITREVARCLGEMALAEAKKELGRD